MSKVVKGVGRAVSSVVKGVGNAVKKVAKSKLGKALLVAAAVYFGGAALMGGMAAPAGSGLSGFLSGAGQGIANAWGGLTGAASSALSGNFASAGSKLSAGFQGTTVGALEAAAASPASYAGSLGTKAATGANSQAAMLAAQTGEFGTAGLKATQAAAAKASGAVLNQPTGLIGKMMASPYAAPALITTGGQLIGGAMQGVGMQKQYEQQRNLEAEARERYNRNVGANMGWA